VLVGLGDGFARHVRQHGIDCLTVADEFEEQIIRLPEFGGGRVETQACRFTVVSPMARVSAMTKAAIRNTSSSESASRRANTSTVSCSLGRSRRATTAAYSASNAVKAALLRTLASISVERARNRSGETDQLPVGASAWATISRSATLGSRNSASRTTPWR